MAEKIEAGELEVQALKDLLEVAVKLKEMGIIGMLKEFLSNSEENLAGLQADVSLLRLGVLLGAMLEASRRLPGEKTASLKMNVEDASYCLFSSLADTNPAKTKKVGLTGLMGALRDPDVQKGLGFLIGMAKNLGACLRKLEKEG
ncbi:MAG: DUF1641 domain-containing protein [Desulfurococcales archaeon]|nr:DUF1641 domain-containing protein [Desulfurococcales archaeon]